MTGCPCITTNNPFSILLTVVTSLLISPPNALILEKASDIDEIPIATCPIIINNGPSTAIIAPITTIAVCTPSGRAENLFTKSVINSATFVITGANLLPIVIAAVSREPFISSIARDPSPICELASLCAASWSFVAFI